MCNSPGEALPIGVKSAALRPPVLRDLGGDKHTNKQTQTHTHTQYQYYYLRLAETRSQTGFASNPVSPPTYGSIRPPQRVMSKIFRKPLYLFTQSKLFTSVQKALRYDIPFPEISEGTNKQTDKQTHTHRIRVIRYRLAETRSLTDFG